MEDEERVYGGVWWAIGSGDDEGFHSSDEGCMSADGGEEGLTATAVVNGDGSEGDDGDNGYGFGSGVKDFWERDVSEWNNCGG